MFKQGFIVIAVSFLFGTVGAQPPKTAVNAYADGVAFYAKGMLPEAMQAFKKAATLYKRYDSAYVQMGNIYSKQNNFDTALLQYNKALAINPKQALAFTGMGTVYRDGKRDYDKAISSYLAAVKIDSSRKETFYGLAWCYNSKKDHENAIIYAARALDLDVKYRPGYNEMAHAYHALKKYPECIEHFKKYLAIAITDQPLYYSGLCYLELKDTASATKMYEELVKIESKMAPGLKKRIDAAANQPGN